MDAVNTPVRRTRREVHVGDTKIEQKADIDAGIADLEAGRKRPHNQVIKDAKSLLK